MLKFNGTGACIYRKSVPASLPGWPVKSKRSPKPIEQASSLHHSSHLHYVNCHFSKPEA